MPTTNLPEVPQLIIPPAKQIEPVVSWGKPLKLRYVTGVDAWGLIFNLTSALVLFCLSFIVIAVVCRVKDLQPHPVILYGIPTCLVYVLITLNYEKLWTGEVLDGEAVIYFDHLLKEIVVYSHGLYLNPWTARRWSEKINLRECENASPEREGVPNILCKTNDGLHEMELEVKTCFVRLDGEMSLKESLRHPLSDIKDFVHSAVVSRVAEIIGHNSPRVCLAREREIANLIGDIFDNESKMTPFKKSLGIGIRRPVLKSLKLTTESEQSVALRTRLELLEKKIKVMRKAGLGPNETSRLLQATLGISNRNTKGTGHNITIR